MKKRFSFAKIKITTKFLSVLCLVGIMLAVGSCTTTIITPTQILSPDYEPTNQDGYIYGRFFVKRETPGFFKALRTSRNWGELTVSIVVQHIDTEEKYNFVLKSEENKVFQIFAVPPGNYRIDTVEYLDGARVRDSQGFTMAGYQRDFVVEANIAVYLGDFSGNTIIQVGSAEYQYWRLPPPTDNYDTTTATIKEKYPLLTEPPITFVSNIEGFSPKNNDKGMERGTQSFSMSKIIEVETEVETESETESN